MEFWRDNSLMKVRGKDFWSFKSLDYQDQVRPH
jgi:hypothetical protein